MADISTEISAIKVAEKGAEVRDSIVSALSKMNTQCISVSNSITTLNNNLTSKVTKVVKEVFASELATVTSDISSLKTRATGLETRMKTAETDIDNLESTLSSHSSNNEASFKTVNSKIESLQTSVSTLSDSTTTINSSIESINDSLTAIDEEQTSQNDRLDALEAKDEEFTTELGNLAAADAELETRVEAVETDLAAVDTKIASANEYADELFNGVDGKLSDLQTKINDDLSKSLKSLTDRADSIEEQNAAVQVSINSVMTNVNTAMDDAAAAYELASGFADDINSLKEQMEIKLDDLEIEDEDGSTMLYGVSNGIRTAGPVGPFSGTGGGGGGGGSTNNAVLTASNVSGFISKTVTKDATVLFVFSWSSLEDGTPTGSGSVKITNNNVVASVQSIAQGYVTLDLTPYLVTGTNTIRFDISDIYGNTKTMRISISVIELTITSSFDNTLIYSGTITFPYIPVGSLSKTVHFILDGVEIGTQSVSSSGRQQTYYINQQEHGSHSLEVYFTGIVDNQDVESNHLYYDITCVKAGNYTPIIAVNYNTASVDQFSTISIPYSVYDPSTLTAEIELRVNGVSQNKLTVDRTLQYWSYRADNYGTNTLEIICGETVKTITIYVNQVEISFHAEENDLALYLSSYGRSNNEDNPGTWVYNGIECTFENFNFKTDGWMRDDDGIVCCRVTGDGRITIPLKLFGEDFRTTGKTIEFDLATRDIRNYDDPIISCWETEETSIDGITVEKHRGIRFTANQCDISSEQASQFLKYKEDEHIRVSFVVTKRSDTRLILIYLDGVMSACAQYPDNDDFAQKNPLNITIGSNECTVDLYTIRVYDNDLTKEQIVSNWVADTQDGSLMMERYLHNNIMDDYGQIAIEKLPNDLPYLVLVAEQLPVNKQQTTFTCDGQYVDPVNSAFNFTFTGASIKIQGTSSAGYARKNYKIKFKNGFEMESGHVSKYALTSDSIPANTFTFKADVASSEGCNNTELVRLYNDLCPYKTPAQEADSRVRQGIDGYPIVIFWNNGETTTFLGKYNFNNDKSTAEVYGFGDGDQSWETCNNTSARALFQSDDFSDDDPTTGWPNDFERRYPKLDDDEVGDPTDLKNFISNYVDTSAVTRNTFSNTSMINSAIFYYNFTHFNLMTDSRAKNAFPTRFDEDGKWCWFPYDFDTALGINNEGELVFTYSLEDTDQIVENGAAADVFNGQRSNYWNTLRDLYPTEIKNSYVTLRDNKMFSYDAMEKRFEDHQSKWPEMLFNEDSQFKYLDPLIDDGDSSYLGMLQGSKKSQRQWWLYNRFRYFDSKYNCGDDLSNYIEIRAYSHGSITVTPYMDQYVNVRYGSYLVTTRGWADNAYLMEMPSGLTNLNDTECYIYSCDRLRSVGDLSALMVGRANFTKATRLEEIILGSNASGYQNGNLKRVDIGNNTLLKKIDCRNCTALGTGEMSTIDLSGCTNLEECYFDNTKITGVTLPEGGMMTALHLPNTVTNLTIKNQPKITNFLLGSGTTISTLDIENVSNSVNTVGIMKNMLTNSRVRFIGFNLVQTASELESFIDLLDKFRGIDENGNNMDVAQVQGTIVTRTVTGALLKRIYDKYPYIKVEYEHVTCTVSYYTYKYVNSKDEAGNVIYDEDGLPVMELSTTLVKSETVSDGGNATYTGTPSKSADNYFTYTFAGWSRTPGGEVDPQAQLKIEQDTDLYAEYTSSIRMYNVYFYVGSILKQTSQTSYGGTVEYLGPTPEDPTGAGREFSRWEPLNKNITADTSCRAKFRPTVEETILDDWATIIARCQNGTYKSAYSIGDTKTLILGEEEDKLAFEIAAFDTDILADGSGNAPISWICKQLPAKAHRYNPAVTSLYKEAYVGPAFVYDDVTEFAWISQNAGYADTTATSTWVVKPKANGKLLISYKNIQYYNDTFTITVNGTRIIYHYGSSYSMSSYSLYEYAVEAGETYTVTVRKYNYNSTSAYKCYVRIESSVESDIEDQISQIKINVFDKYKIGTGGIGGWLESEIRAYLKGLKTNLPAALQSGIREVKKTTAAYTETGSSYTQTTEDDLWLAAYSEMNSSTAYYGNVLGTADNRKKSTIYDDEGTYQIYFTRTPWSYANVYTITKAGASSYADASNLYYYIIGFCT